MSIANPFTGIRSVDFQKMHYRIGDLGQAWLGDRAFYGLSVGGSIGTFRRRLMAGPKPRRIARQLKLS